MTIRHLKIFLKVAETGNMSLAAKQLYLSQPTVSQAIRELEEHYDTQLLSDYPSDFLSPMLEKSYCSTPDRFSMISTNWSRAWSLPPTTRLFASAPLLP